MASYTLISLAFILNLIGCGLAISCMECLDIPHPHECGYVVSCHDDHSCLTRHYVTSSGVMLFSSGCVSNQKCEHVNTKSRSLEPEPEVGEDPIYDLDTCLECCNDTNYCNIQGCGTSVANLNARGPYCFECSVQNDVFGCRQVRLCDVGYSCAIMKSNFHGMYRTGCVLDYDCDSREHILHSITSKRSAHTGLTIPLPHCCKTDFCNDILNYVANSSTPVDGGWSGWGIWSRCSLSCGWGGKQSRSRSCINPPSQNGGAGCPGNTTDSRDCMDMLCPVDGEWSAWGGWTTCPQTCDTTANRTRTRDCNNPPPKDNGAFCQGQHMETEHCGIAPCPVDGGWSAWDGWTTCPQTCDSSANRTRTRDCNNPPPKDNGAFCQGQHMETEHCGIAPCPVDGEWSAWGGWTTCPQTCDSSANRTRTRDCNNPSPKDNGAFCQGQHMETEHCGIAPCPVDGSWSDWTPWTPCHQTCGNHTQVRTRACNHPLVLFGGLDCPGYTTDVQFCPLPQCPIDGMWSQWGPWSTCSVSCGNGTMLRTRTCSDPAPRFNGTDCTGHWDHQTHLCSLGHCLEEKCRAVAGYDYIPGDGSHAPLCLQLNTSPFTWDEGRAYCANHGGHLAILDSKDVNDAAYRYFWDKHHSHPDNVHGHVWIGLKQAHHTWEWVHHAHHYQYNNFEDHHGPADIHHIMCARIEHPTHQWHTRPCAERSQILCQMDM